MIQFHVLVQHDDIWFLYMCICIRRLNYIYIIYIYIHSISLHFIWYYISIYIDCIWFYFIHKYRYIHTHPYIHFTSKFGWCDQKPPGTCCGFAQVAEDSQFLMNVCIHAAEPCRQLQGWDMWTMLPTECLRQLQPDDVQGLIDYLFGFMEGCRVNCWSLYCWFGYSHNMIAGKPGHIHISVDIAASEQKHC